MECALFGNCPAIFYTVCGIFNSAMLRRLSPYLLLSKVHLDAARSILTARYPSRSCATSDSEDSRGGRSKESPMAKLEHSFQLLGVTKHDCTVEQIRKAYTDLVKQYHPDSRTPHASDEKSAEIRDAYKRCMSYARKVSMTEESSAAIELELKQIDQSLGFTRQHHIPDDVYLTQDYFQRQVAYAQERISQRKAEFRGMGKSIRMERDSPILDDVQEKLNNMMGNAGFAPEWISLDKDVRQSIENVKKHLSACWSKCGPHPMTPVRKKEWEQELEELSQTVNIINKNIASLNLIVPTLSAQRALIRLKLLVSRVTATPPSSVEDYSSEQRSDEAKPPDHSINSHSEDHASKPQNLVDSLVNSTVKKLSVWFKSWQDKS